MYDRAVGESQVPDLRKAMDLPAIHHRAFDLGAIGIDLAMCRAASGKLRGLVGSPAVAALFGQLQARVQTQGTPVLPSRQGGLPAQASVDWHWRNVFVKPALAPPAPPNR